MKPIGIVRNVDKLGRFVIPMEWRKVKGWDENTALEAFAMEEGLLLREYKPKFDDSIIDELAVSKQTVFDDETKEAYNKVIEHMRKTKKSGVLSK